MSHAETIAEFFHRTVAARGNRPALGFIRSGELHWRTWEQISYAAHELAATLRVAGLAPGDRVAHVSENRYEWVITDLALHLAAAVHVPIHVTLSGEQIAAQIADCEARFAFVSNEPLLEKIADKLPDGMAVHLHDNPSEPPGSSRRSSEPLDTAEINPAARKTNPSSLATILYTSGTTGRPRGVMLSHANLATNAAATAETFGMEPDQTRLCILPLSHIYARTCDLYTWVVAGSRLVIGESRETLARDCQLVHPMALNAVPYLYQKISDKVRASGADDESAALRNFFGGKIEWLACGGAPLGLEAATWYAERGLPVLCGYGLTESSPVISMSTRSSHRAGASGRILPGVEVRIADDGEILARGSNIMLGYWHDPTATAEVIRDGWLHTGDLGHLDADGFLCIRGRKKELIVLSTGKKVVPTRVENLLTVSPLIEQAVVFGEGQAALVALIVPTAACGGAAPAILSGGSEHDAQRELYCAEIGRCLAGAAQEEQVRQFTLLDRPLSIDRGELTPKLSLCREVIARNFAAELQRITSQGSRSAQR